MKALVKYACGEGNVDIRDVVEVGCGVTQVTPGDAVTVLGATG